MNRLSRWLDPIFGAALAASLLMALVTAWPGMAQAADRLVGNGDVVSEPRSAGDFDAVLTVGPKVVVQQGTASAVSVRTDRNLLPLLETVVEDRRNGKTLVVRWKRGSHVSTRSEPVITVTVARLSSLAVSGSGDLSAVGLRQPTLSASVEGSGDLRLDDVAVDGLSLSVAGSGDVAASGRAAKLSVNIAGSGDVDAGAVKAEEVSVHIAGSGDASVHADKSLAVNIAGSGDVVYSGQAAVTKRIAGSGDVTRR